MIFEFIQWQDLVLAVLNLWFMLIEISLSCYFDVGT
jgi:hypothetical protein